MMRIVMTSLAALALAGCNQAADTTANDMAATNDAMMANDMMAPAATGEITRTSWEFTEDGKPMLESIDENGNYIVSSGGKHVDHGTAVMKDGKACFTSAMTDEGEVCWTDPMVEVGQSGETTSDKGEKLTVKRVEYVVQTM